MAKKTPTESPKPLSLPKCPSGIEGLDEITGGGLPQGRPTLICGTAGCGKTLFGMEFLVRGASEFGEPGVFMAFEETAEELAQNVRSLGFDLEELVAQKKLAIDYVRVERSEIEETGEYDLEGLFVRLGFAIDSIGAKRVVLDTIESLFASLSNQGILRAELRRLFRWLKDKGVTALISAERGEGTLTRHGLEEYVSDCVILLDHRVTEQISTRRLRIVKYRGSVHGNNEYPFLIDAEGISVLPVTSMGLQHEVSNERVSSGIPRLDSMLTGHGYYRGSSVLVSGTAGSGKTSVAASFVDAACRRGERAMYFAFEESEGQFVRNMRSIGIDVAPWIQSGLLRFHASRPTLYGLEMHLATIHNLVNKYKPQAVVIDPLSNFTSAGSTNEVKSMLMRLIDFLKFNQITVVFTNLTSGGGPSEQTDVGVSSLMDTWLLLRDMELGGERNRSMYILKSRGMAHSNQLREFLLTDRGVDLLNVYLGPEGVLTGSARLAQEAREKAETLVRREEIETKQRDLERQRQVLESQIAALRAEFEAKESELSRAITQQKAKEAQFVEDRVAMAHSRKSDADGDKAPPTAATAKKDSRKERRS
jgi:circadian clock protein KaiC